MEFMINKPKRFRVYQSEDNTTVLQHVPTDRYIVIGNAGGDDYIERVIRACDKDIGEFNEWFIMDDAERYQDDARLFCEENNEVTNYYFGNYQGL